MDALMNNDELSRAFQDVLRNSLSQRDMSRLIHLGGQLATAILRVRFARYLPILHEAGYDTQDAAARCVEDLFLPEHGIACAALAALLRLEDMEEAQSEQQSLRIFKKLLYLHLQQNIPELLGEFGPEYRKILRLVRDEFNNNGYQLFRGRSEDLYYRNGSPGTQLKSMPMEELLPFLTIRAKHRNSVQAIMKDVFDILEADEEYNDGISAADMVTLIRDFYCVFWEDSFEEVEEAPMFDYSDIDRLVEEQIRYIRAGILASYLRKGAIDEDDAMKYETACRNMLRDIALRTPSPWFLYYKELYPDCDKQSYRAKARYKFEYVLGTAKERFLTECREYFSD
jgi:hypothetical protein